MTYAVKEIFLTLQGEGMQAGRRAIFLRFTGCNLWSGLERDRSTAVCKFCDTDFVGTNGVLGGKYDDANALVYTVAECWGPMTTDRFIVITGGEPLLQLDPPLIEALHAHGFSIAVESNGTLPALPGIDWLCISPKAGSETVQRKGQELKLVWPQTGSDWEDMRKWEFEHFLIQPCDDAHREENTRDAIAFVQAHPEWRLSIQMHKFLGLS